MKQSRKSLKASIINEISKEYKQKYNNIIQSLQERLDNLIDVNKKLRNENYQLKDENLKLKDEINSLLDWNNRLKQWMDLPESEREKEIENHKIKKQNAQIFKDLYMKFEPYFRLFNI